MTDLLRRRLLLALVALPAVALPAFAAPAKTTPPRAAPRPKPAPKVAAAPAPARRKATAPRKATPRAAPPAPPPLLNAKVQERLGELRSAGLLGRGETSAWVVHDLTWNRTLVAINASTGMQAASMIKPFVAAAYFIQSARGTPALRYTAERRARLEDMIVHSDNDATNGFIRLCGGPAGVHATLRRFAPDVFRQTAVLEYIPGGGRTYRNRASALDYARFMQALWARRFPNAAELLRVMNIPNRDRLYEGADGVARTTEVYDKTGTTARLCGDMGILVARGRNGGEYPYAFAGIIQRSVQAPDYGHFMRTRGDCIRAVSSLVYQELKTIHGLV